MVSDREAVFNVFMEGKWNTFKHMEHILSFGLLDSVVLEIEMSYAFPKTVPYLPKLDSVVTPFFCFFWDLYILEV